jgi:hypothetical protein
MVNRLANWRNAIGYGASLMKVFLPYLVWNTVFDNTRVVSEMGCAPAPFSEYCYPLLVFAKKNRFAYPYREWPSDTEMRDAGCGMIADRRLQIADVSNQSEISNLKSEIL